MMEAKKYGMKDGLNIIMGTGTKMWFRNGVKHREDGPAVDGRYCSDGSFDLPRHQYQQWWIEGRRVPCTTQEEFEKWMRLKAFW
jgi:hypothetical protein